MLTRHTLTKAAVSVLTVASLAGAPALAVAQNSSVPVPPPAHGSQDLGPAPADVGPSSDMGQQNLRGPDMGRPNADRGPGYGARGYDAPPPPPPAGYDRSHATRPEDRAYARAYAQWAQQRAAYDYERCAQKHRTGATLGAVIGGIAGAVIGSNAAPRWDRTGGTVAGGALGAVAGGAIGSNNGGACPPPPYAYGPGPGAFYGPGPVYGPGPYYGPAYVGPAFYGPPVVYGGPVVTYRVGPRWGWHHRYWRRW
jgi:hypothetical protein